MDLPEVADVQFLPACGKFHVDELLDPSGSPVEVLDIDLGFSLRGRVELPGWFSGAGVVQLAADEIGGPIDTTIGSVTVPITGATSPIDPPVMTYEWTIHVSGTALPDQSKMYKFAVAFIVQTQAGGHTDIGGLVDLGSVLVV